MAHQIAVIDDSEINLTLLKHLVGRLPECEPRLFADPHEGLSWCQAEVPDLVIVDYMMPGMDGVEFIRRFRGTAGREEIPLLMITANDEREVRYQALDSGANDFLTKPIDKHEFLARTRNMLALRVSQKHLADRAEWLTVEVNRATAEIAQRERELIFRISRAAEFRDPETGAHIQRMAHYSRLIAQGLGMPAATQQLILEAAPMHDVGKIGIPDYILLKPGRLTREEFELMKRHAQLGYELLKESGSKVLQLGAEIALTHHEKFDGSGYPRGLSGEAIPLPGRIVAVADVFDALTSERPYKRAWDVEQAADYLREEAGKHFDPLCVEVFLGAWATALEIRARFQDEVLSMV